MGITWKRQTKGLENEADYKRFIERDDRISLDVWDKVD
jgi:hypothetical protein